MQSKEILASGLGLTAPWRLIDQRLDIESSPHVLQLSVAADRGAAFACPIPDPLDPRPLPFDQTL